MREPLEFLVRLLLAGGRVVSEGQTYAMGEDGSLCVLLHDGNGRINHE